MAEPSIRKNLAWMGGMSLAGQVITWTITIIVARLLTPADYGLVALSGLFCLFASYVSEMGVGAAVIQHRDISREQISSLYAISLLVGGGMTVVGVLVSPLVAMLFTDPRLRGLVAFQSLVFVLGAAKSMQRTVLVRGTRFDIIAKVDVAARVATSFCTLGLVTLGITYWALAAQGLFFELFQFLLFSIIVRVRPRFRFRFAEIAGVLRFGVDILARNVLGQLYRLTDTAILGKLATKDFVGAYGYARQLADLPFEKIMAMVNQVLFPYLSREQSDLPRLRMWTMRIAELQALFIAPFFSLLFFCPDEIVTILLGPKWVSAVFVLKVFCAANLFKLVEDYAGLCLTAVGKVPAQSRYLLVQLVVVGGGMLTLALTVGVRQSVLVWVTAYPVIIVLYSRILLRTLGLRIGEVLWHLRTAFAGHGALILTVLAISHWVRGSPWVTLSAKCLAGTTAYVAVVLLLDFGKVKDLLLLLRPDKKAGQVSGADAVDGS